MKRFLVIMLTLLAIALLAMPASAAPKEKRDMPTGVMSPDPLNGSSESDSIDPIQAAASGGLIMKGACSISNIGNGNVQIFGYTQTYSSVSSISVTAYLQRWTGSQWVDVTGVTSSGTNTDYISTAKTIAVTKGFYYRTRAVHSAASGSTSDTTNSTTSYIYI